MRSLTQLSIIAGLALLVSLSGVRAQENGAAVVVVELFTSQGCYSCPPADKLLHEMSDDEGIIPLALHVDYWDYIGWKDTFGSPAFSARQRAYARAAGRRSVYTPQMIVNGADEVVGNRPMDVAALIRKHGMKQPDARLTLARSGDTLNIAADAMARPDATDVILVRYLPEAVVEIKRGENAGKQLVYSNIVTEWRMIGGWDGHAPLAADIPVTGDAPVVVLLQKPGHGPIVAAARLR